MLARALLLLLCLAGCGEGTTEEPASPEPEGVRAIGSAESRALPDAPHEGRVLRVGPHAVEVRLYERGRVDAWILGAAPRPSDIRLHADVATSDGVRDVALAWNPEEARYEGEAGVPATTGRLALRLEIDGASHRGAVEPLAPHADPASPGTVIATPVEPSDSVSQDEVPTVVPRSRGRRRTRPPRRTGSANTDAAGNSESGERTDSAGAGSGGAGSESSNSGSSGSDSSGSGNSGSGNSDSGSSGSDSSGAGNSGAGNSDSGNSDSGNSDSGNSGSGNSGSGNSGSGNSGSTGSGETSSGGSETPRPSGGRRVRPAR